MSKSSPPEWPPEQGPQHGYQQGDTAAPSLAAAKVFVGAVFILLGAGFLASTYLLMIEFPDQWRTLAIAHSHIFIFFPLFGIVALMAFYLPSVIFTDLYWRHLPLGLPRFALGFVVAIGASWYVSTFLLGPFSMPRALWEIAPRTLATDRGEPADCAANRARCNRLGLMQTLQSLRDKASGPTSLSKFARPCEPDPLLETPEEHTKQRWCFPAGRLATAAECCVAQASYANAVNTRAVAPATRSKLADYDEWLQPLKIFFILVVLVIGVMLVVWRSRIEAHYPHQSGRIERHVMIGGIAMLLWPIMDYAYLDATNTLFGRPSDDVQIRLSLVAAPWSMLLLFYYLRRFARNIEVLGQIVGVAGGVTALIVRDELKDWSVRLVGIGMPWWMPWVMLALCIAGIVALFVPRVDAFGPGKTGKKV